MVRPWVSKVASILFAMLAAALPARGADEVFRANADTLQLPAGFNGESIEALIASARHAPKGQFESTAAFQSRTRYPAGEPILLVDATACHPFRTYDPDKPAWTVKLVSLATLFPLSCGKRMLGLKPSASLDHIVDVPMANDVAAQVDKDMRIWLAFRRAALDDVGRVWRTGDEKTGPEGLVAGDLAVWISDASGKVLAKVPLKARTQPQAEEFPQPQFSSSSTIGTAEKKDFNFAQACASPNRLELVRAHLDRRTLWDIQMQLEGMQAQGEERGTTYDAYLARAINSMCSPTGGYPFQVDMSSFVFKLNGEMYCSSANRNGSHYYDCKEEYPLNVPPELQLCKVTYRSDTWRHGRISVKPTLFPAEAAPARVSGVVFGITGHGDVDNESGARIWDIEVTALPDSATLDDRRRRGCQFLDNPGSLAKGPASQGPKPSTQPQTQTPDKPKTPARLSGHMVNQTQDSNTMLLMNTGGTAGRTCWHVSVTDGDDGKRKTMGEGCIDLDPGQEFRQGYTKWRNRGDWVLKLF